MISKVDLHLRSHAADEHRSLGLAAVEHDGARLAPYDEIVYDSDGRHVRAQITSIHQRGDHVPHVYADECAAEEAVA